jgi:hypothetical protein
VSRRSETGAAVVALAMGALSFVLVGRQREAALPAAVPQQ